MKLKGSFVFMTTQGMHSNDSGLVVMKKRGRFHLNEHEVGFLA